MILVKQKLSVNRGYCIESIEKCSKYKSDEMICQAIVTGFNYSQVRGTDKKEVELKVDPAVYDKKLHLANRLSKLALDYYAMSPSMCGEFIKFMYEANVSKEFINQIRKGCENRLSESEQYNLVSKNVTIEKSLIIKLFESAEEQTK